MGARSGYGPGTFCWANLSSTDPEAARRFYGELFGWSYDDRTGDDGGFWMARRYGANVAAIYRREEQERAQGLPPHWNNYVSVSDAGAAAAHARELGGTVFEEPFDVSDAGRTAVIIDPAGAMFWVWQPRAHIGAGHVNDVGCLTWNELYTNDAERAIEFYSSLFGWGFERVDTGDAEPTSWLIGNDAAAEGRNGGMRKLADPDAEPIWIPHFRVDSATSTARTRASARSTASATRVAAVSNRATCSRLRVATTRSQTAP